jgi:hypothetical protein
MVNPISDSSPTLLPFRLLRVVIIFTIAGWLFGAVTVSDDGFLPALISLTALRAAAVATVISALCAPLIVWSGRWFVGPIVALLIAPPAVYIHFLLWPVESWKMGASKATQVVLSSYWEYLLPIAVIGGVFAGLWALRGRSGSGRSEAG